MSPPGAGILPAPGTFFTTVSYCSPSTSPSRPKPLSFTPPNGVSALDATKWLIDRLPTSTPSRVVRHVAEHGGRVDDRRLHMRARHRRRVFAHRHRTGSE
jgi:hypothetical protein